MGNVAPLDDGRSVVDEETLNVSSMFAIGQDMVDLGYKMVSADVDESGHFITIQFENIKLNHLRHWENSVPLCKDDGDGDVMLDRNAEYPLCQKCARLMDERKNRE